MDKNHPHLTLIDPSNHPDLNQEFEPLPYYPWEVRPSTLPIDADEAATAIHLAHGDCLAAAALLKVPLHRLSRLVKQSPRLKRILDESYELALIAAVSVPLQTIFDPDADHRRREWASTKLLASRLAQGHPLSPAPAASTMTVSPEVRPIVVLWGDGTKIAELGPAGSEPAPKE
jgi:hypothetical protein